jgi:hypothetical protein
VTVSDIAGIPNQFSETMASSYFLVPCYATLVQDCSTIPTGMVCGNQNAPFEQQGWTQTEVFRIGGQTGSSYGITLNVNGIVGAKYYAGGTRDGGDTIVTNAQDPGGSDTFYRGGSPVPVEHYGIYKMTVKDAAGTEVNHYYLNSFPQTTVAYENHQTFPIHFAKTIVVPGGGTVEYFIGSSNCRMINNCGPGIYTGTCTASRNIPGEPNFVVPTMYMGGAVQSLNLVNGASQPFHAQIIHVTVTAVSKL